MTKGNILTDGPEAIAATQTVPAPAHEIRAARRRGLQLDGERWPRFTQGRAAMWLDGSRLGAPARKSRSASRVVGKVGYSGRSERPEGGNTFAATYGDGIGVAQTSKNKEAAYLYCQWAVSKADGRAARAKPAAACRSAIRSSMTRPCASGVKMPAGMAAIGDRLIAKSQQARAARDRHSRRRIPRCHRGRR